MTEAYKMGCNRFKHSSETNQAIIKSQDLLKINLREEANILREEANALRAQVAFHKARQDELNKQLTKYAVTVMDSDYEIH